MTDIDTARSFGDVRYAVSYTGNYDAFEEFIKIINGNRNLEYKDKKWLVSPETFKQIQNSIPSNNYFYECISGGESSTSEVKDLLKFPLYPYQKDFVDFCLKTKKGIIVAPCGAGKTACALSLFLNCREHGYISSNAQGLIVVKASLKYQWLSEVSKFSNLKAVILDTYKSVRPSYHTKIRALKKKMEPLLKDAIGNANEIAGVDREITKYQEIIDKEFEANFSSNYDLFIANYETLRDDEVRKRLHKTNLQFIMADEVQAIKSDTSARSKALCEFADVKMRFGATATPIQKNPLDAYGITKFISPTTFKSKSSFSLKFLTFSGFGRISGSKNEKELNKILSEFMVVKTKEEVSSQLPNLVPITRYCKLTPKQIEMTQRLLDEINEFKEQERSLRMKLGASADNHEDILKIQANIMARQTFASELADSEELLLESESDMAKRYITNSKSSKIELLLDLLDEIIDSGEKAAIFSKYRKLQPILAKAILNRFTDIKIAYINGEVSAEDRFDAINKFQEQDDYKVLLLSDAGAEGINLKACKYLIEMEPADSYLIQTQRRGRVERADSIHDTVFAYQLIAEESYDEIGLKIIEKKERYDAQIIKGNLE